RLSRKEHFDVRAANVDDQGFVRFCFSACLHHRSFNCEKGPVGFRAAQKLASDCAFPAADVNSFAQAAEENAKLRPAVFGIENGERDEGRKLIQIRLGWEMGFEPTTFGATDRRSTN